MRSRLRSLWWIVFRRSRWEQDMNEELEFHIKLQSERLERSGMPHVEAMRRARLEFGSLEAYKERCREAGATGWIDELARNLRYAGRSMRRGPGFTAVALLSLTLGIGANVAIFSLLRRLVLATLPVRDPGRLYQLVLTKEGRPWSLYNLSYPKFEKLRDNFDFFESLFGWGEIGSDRGQELTAANRKHLAHVIGVTGTYFEDLGVRPALGRLVIARDDHAGAADVVVISTHIWKSMFNSDPGVLGRTVKIGKFTFQIVGVTPPSFSGMALGQRPDVYVPLHAAEHFSGPNALKNEGALWIYFMARLKPGVPLATAQAALREGWARLDRPRQVVGGDHSAPEIMVLEEGGHGYSPIRQQFSPAIVALMGLVTIVFLIACANLATLLFVRGAGRTREISIRLALGARRSQLVRQWMTECVLLAACGGTAGLLVAHWLTDLLLVFVTEADRPWLRFQASPLVLAFALALTVAAGLLFGLLPAWRASSTSPDTVLRERAPAGLAGRGSLAQAVLAGQLAASLVLVVGAVLFARTLWNLNTANGGFDRKTIVYADLVGGGQEIQNRAEEVLKEIIDRLNHSPHIAAASLASHPPILYGTSAWWGWVTVPGYAYSPDEDNEAAFNSIGTGYFRTMGIRMIAGRDFDDRDGTSWPVHVAIVNEQFARHYFSGKNPIGQKFRLRPQEPLIEIVGVVGDSKDGSLRETQKDLVYFHGGGTILARAKPGVALSVCEAEIRSTVAAVSKSITLETGRLEEAIQRTLSRDRLVTQLSAGFGLLGILLAIVGLYGAVAHSVSSRTREIGVRMALGADPWRITRLVLQQSLTVTVIGILIGVPAAAAGSRLIGSLLFEVSPTDPLTLAVSAMLLSAVSLLAGLWPARRAARTDPMAALRCE